MSWQPFNQLNINYEWQFTDETDSEFFKFRHSNLGSIARTLICQASIIDGEMFLFQVREMGANQNEVWQISKPPIFDNRRLGFCQIYGAENTWNIQIEEFMGLNNIGSINLQNNTFNSANNTTVSLTANTAATVLAANANRKYAIIINNGSGDVTVMLGGTAGTPPTGVTIGNGIILIGKGAHYEIGPHNLYIGLITAISGSAGSLSVVEG